MCMYMCVCVCVWIYVCMHVCVTLLWILELLMTIVIVAILIYYIEEINGGTHGIFVISAQIYKQFSESIYRLRLLTFALH